MKKLTAIALLATAIITLVAVQFAATPVKAFEVPFDWSCNAAGNSCRAPGLQPRAQKFPPKFFKELGYPQQIVVENKEDYDAVNSGWTKGGNCMARLEEKTYPEVSLAKAKFCKFWQVGYAAPKPQIVKGWRD